MSEKMGYKCYCVGLFSKQRRILHWISDWRDQTDGGNVLSNDANSPIQCDGDLAYLINFPEEKRKKHSHPIGKMNQ